MSQNILEDFDDVVCATGSGGTATGLAVANYLTGSKLKIHTVLVADEMESISQHVKSTLEELGLHNAKPDDVLDIIDGYFGKGYSLTTSEDITDITELARATGIFLDPVYTGKALSGLLKELQFNIGRFKGNRILFIHTGGIFLYYDGRFCDELSKKFDELYVKS